MRVNLTKEEFMHAYASEYYDPVKAHEYYERTKQLKGRSTSGMSDEQKESWNYVKKGIMTEKQQKTDEIQKTYNAEVEKLQSEASAARERISAKLKSWLESISNQTESERKTLSKTAQQQKEEIQLERQRQIDALPPIPKTASPAQKDRMRALNEQQRSVINADAKAKLEKVDEAASAQREDISVKSTNDKTVIRGSAEQERKVVSENLKTVISSARDKIKEIKETLNNTTEETLNKEYENIMQNIAGKPLKGKKGKKSGGDSAAREKFIADNLAKLKPKG